MPSERATPEPVTIAVTDHAVERFRQRVPGRTGDLETRTEIVGRVGRAWQAGRSTETPPDGGSAPRGTSFVADLIDRDVVFICRHDRPRCELVVITLWERERLGTARVPRQFTDALAPRRPKRLTADHPDERT